MDGAVTVDGFRRMVDELEAHPRLTVERVEFAEPAHHDPYVPEELEAGNARRVLADLFGEALP